MSKNQKPDVSAIAASLEKAIVQGKVTLPLTRFRLTEVCEKPAIRAKYRTMWDVLKYWEEAIDREKQYIRAKAVALIYGEDSAEFGLDAKRIMDESRKCLTGFYPLVDMTKGDNAATLNQQFRGLDTLARNFVTHVLKAPIKQI